jgi:hypothetical protein
MVMALCLLSDMIKIKATHLMRIQRLREGGLGFTPTIFNERWLIVLRKICRLVSDAQE